jgi:hypothetical protein
MKILLSALLLGFGSGFGHCFAQSTLQITFDGPPIQAPGTSRVVTNYFELGMLFTATNPITHNITFSRSGGGSVDYPEDGTAYLQPGPSTLMFNYGSDIAFGLLSVDLAEWSTYYSNQPTTIPFVGYQLDGATITNVFTTDGIIDGTGPLADFQTFYFTNFTDLTRVEIPGPSEPSGWQIPWSMDNLVVTTPEPTVGGLLVIGGLIFGAWKIRRWRR